MNILLSFNELVLIKFIPIKIEINLNFNNVILFINLKKGCHILLIKQTVNRRLEILIRNIININRQI